MTNVPPKKKLKQMSLTSMFEASITPKMNTMEECKKGDKSPNLALNMKGIELNSAEDKDNAGEIIGSNTNTEFQEKRTDCKGKKEQKNEREIVKSRKELESEKCSAILVKNIPSSPDMFDSQDNAPEMLTWRGSSIAGFTRLSRDNLNLPPVIPSIIHKVYIKTPILENVVPSPWPKHYEDAWDSRHVRMPNSPQSLYPNPEGKGRDSGVVQRWPLICRAFESEIRSIEELKEAIFSYNLKYRSKWTFAGLKYLVEKEFCEEEQENFFTSILPEIIRLALSLPKIVCRPIRLLTKYASRSITLSQKQIACLLANAFLCTYPRRNAKGPQAEYSSYPDINFNRLFHHKVQRGLEKLKCIIHYFKEVVKGPDGVVTFSRQSLDHMPAFESSRKVLKRLHIDSKGLIEDAKGLLHVDFANKYIGGGVLGLGCVQEEIRFVLCPELIVSRLFTEVLDRKEALIITGVEQYSKCIGYADTFEWSGPYCDVTLRDPSKRRLCQVVALDALHFSKNPSQQFSHNLIVREIYKAYSGFGPLDGTMGETIGVATGNWGCGAFKGDARLKGLIQIIAASMANRDIAYFTFGDEKLRDDLSDMHEFLVENGITVGELTMALSHYGKSTDRPSGSGLFDYIYKNITVYGGETDSSDNSNPPFNKDNESKNIEKSLQSIKDYFKPKPKSFKIDKSLDTFDNEKLQSGKLSSSKCKKSLTDEKILMALDECDKLVNCSLKSKCESKGDTILMIESDEEEMNATVGTLNSVRDSNGSKLFTVLDKLEK